MAYKRRTKSGRYADEVTFNEIKQCFYLPQDRAAERLGVGVTILKRICRQYGIARWPYKRETQRSEAPAPPCHVSHHEGSEDRMSRLNYVHPYGSNGKNVVQWPRGGYAPQGMPAAPAAHAVAPNLHDLLKSLGSATAPVAPASPPPDTANLGLLLGMLSHVVLAQQQHHQPRPLPTGAYPGQTNVSLQGQNGQVEAILEALGLQLPSAPPPPPPPPSLPSAGLSTMLLQLHAEAATGNDLESPQTYLQHRMAAELTSEPTSPHETQLSGISSGGAFRPFHAISHNQ